MNISNNSVNDQFDRSRFKSFKEVIPKDSGKLLKRFLLGLLLVLIIVMFLPWTQNINAPGYVTTLRLDQRPQTVQSIIAGRIEQWFVQEGEFVNKGDTVLQISEIKAEYLDPNLLDRVDQQLQAKILTRDSYNFKVEALGRQISALGQMQKLKTEQATNNILQARLSIIADSIDYEVAKQNFTIAQNQLGRAKELYDQGLKSLTELEAREMKLQESSAKLIGYESKLLKSRNVLINTQIELSNIKNEFQDKLSKAASERFSAMSTATDTDVEIAKLENQRANYVRRQELYYILAPQDGFITQAIQSGIGETIKEGSSIVSIMPSSYTMAVEMYVKPMDLPLLNPGQEVRFMFDGWPSIVFSGWPNLSFGTFGGKIVAIDNFTNKDGLFRILVSPDQAEIAWPQEIKIGSGAKAFALLNDVPVWYELWRNINGFPAQYYKPEMKVAESKETNK